MRKIIAILLGFICINVMAENFTIQKLHTPNQYVKNAYTGKAVFTEPVLFIEVLNNNNKVILRTQGQSIAGNKDNYFFNEKLKLEDGNFPVIVKVLVSDKKIAEASIRTGSGAVIGAIIGGTITGVLSGGLGAAGGAAIGGLIGGAFGGASVVFAPIQGAHEVTSFYYEKIENFRGIKENTCSGDILLDGKVIKIFIR